MSPVMLDTMHAMRRTDKAIRDEADLKKILTETKHVTVAMCRGDEPYLVTLTHGFDEERNCVYFHCAREGKKVDIMKSNPRIWGQALVDGGYQQGSCDHFYETVQFRGRVTFVDDPCEKEEALRLMIRSLDDDPETIIKKQITPHSTNRVLIGRIDGAGIQHARFVSIDLVHCRLLLHHLPEPEKGLEQLADDVCPGGWLVVEEPDYSSMSPVEVGGPSMASLAETLRVFVDFYRKRGISGYIGRRLRGLVEALGFVDVGHDGWCRTFRGGFPSRFLVMSRHRLRTQPSQCSGPTDPSRTLRSPSITRTLVHKHYK